MQVGHTNPTLRSKHQRPLALHHPHEKTKFKCMAHNNTLSRTGSTKQIHNSDAETAIVNSQEVACHYPTQRMHSEGYVIALALGLGISAKHFCIFQNLSEVLLFELNALSSLWSLCGLLKSCKLLLYNSNHAPTINVVERTYFYTALQLSGSGRVGESRLKAGKRLRLGKGKDLQSFQKRYFSHI